MQMASFKLIVCDSDVSCLHAEGVVWTEATLYLQYTKCWCACLLVFQSSPFADNELHASPKSSIKHLLWQQ